jgi:haloalkane dehalogenase
MPISAVQGIVYMEAIVQPMTWADWSKNARRVFQGFRGPNGEDMVLQKNIFVERVLAGSVLRQLNDEEMAAYRAPFATAEEDRQIPIDGEPAEVVSVVEDYGRWLPQSDVPKLFINAEPGSILTGRAREFCRTWRGQMEVAVKGAHFVQEDSPDEIGQAIATFVRALRSS